MQKLLHGVEDARKQLSLGRTKFYEEVHAGRLTIVKAGKKSLVPQSSLESYVAAKIAEAQPGKAAA
jgi:excisionase family DNA binding protein